MMKKFHSFIICVTFLGLVNCHAQEKKFYSFRKIEQGNGLSSPNIRKITQDKYGYFWYATQDGLNRYDGNNMLVYNSGEKRIEQKTTGNDFHDMLIENDILWALTSNGGLNKINIRTNNVILREAFSKYKEQKDWFRSVSSWKGKLLLSTFFGKIIFYDKNRAVVTRVIDVSKELQKELFAYYSVVKGDNCWLFCRESGIVVYNLSTGKLCKRIEANALFKNKFGEFEKLLLSDSSRKILASVSKGVIEIDNIDFSIKNWYPANVIPEKAVVGQVLSVAQNTDFFFISTVDKVFEYSKRDSSVKEIVPNNYQLEKGWFGNILSIYAGKTSLLLGGQNGIAMIPDLRQQYSSFYSSYDNFSVKINHNYHLCSMGDSVIFSCASDGLYKTNTKTGIIRLMDDSQPYYQAMQLDKKRILVSGATAFKLVEGSRVIDALRYYPSLKIANKDFIIASARLNDSILLMAGQISNSIYIFHTKKGIVDVLNKSSVPLSYDGFEINNFFIDKNGKAIVCSNSSIAIVDYKGKKITYRNLINPESKQPLEAIMDGVEMSDGYFLAVYGTGIVQTDSFFTVKRIFSTSDKLATTGLYKIYRMNDSLVIASSNNGLYILNTRTGKIKLLDNSYGLQSNYFDETSGFLSGRYIYFGGLNGFSRINYTNYFTNSIPPLFYFFSLSIQTDKADNSILDIGINRVKIPNNYTQVRINFIGINYSNPSKTTYAYFIKELQNKWINIGTQNFINFIGIDPGKYHIFVKAANEDGIWSEPKELILIFEPKWYQTWWFKLLVLLIVSGIIYAFYRYRIAQIKKQHEIRKNIATDLHDDLGSTLNSVKVFTNLAISGVKQEESLQQIKDNLNEATTGLRDMIWVLDDSMDTVDELVTRLKQYAIPVTSASNIELKIIADFDAGKQKLTKEEKRNLFLICKEVINNAIKYSGASLIQLHIQPSGKKIRIDISDNGSGFDTEKVKKGYGLNNMQYRAKQISYNVRMESQPGKGTTVTIFC